MSIVRSLAVGDGDTFYIKHNSDNFTIIDCSLSDENAAAIIAELALESRYKGITRFISTHPDDDHIRGLCNLDDALGLLNFYCVANETTKPDYTPDFERYCELRDHPRKAFYVYRGCTRRWMNQSSEERGTSGINILWPITSNLLHQAELARTKAGGSPNNISAIIRYSVENGVRMIWMGDLEQTFMGGIENEILPPRTDVLVAPHHGRDTPPVSWMESMDPGVVVIGEGPTEHQDPYTSYNKIRQNSAGDITFDCVADKVHIYVANYNYSVTFLDNEYLPDSSRYGKYLGTLPCGGD